MTVIQVSIATPLTDVEREMFAELTAPEDGDPGRQDRWINFDPDFKQTEIARMVRRKWIEKQTRSTGREYRLTPAGRELWAVLAQDTSGKGREGE